MTFVYVSAAGADSTEKSRVIWARVRGQTENDLFKLPFKAVYIFRPFLVQPQHGIQSRTKLYQIFYDYAKPLMALLRKTFSSTISTTEEIGRAMIVTAQFGFDKKVLKTKDFARASLSQN